MKERLLRGSLIKQTKATARHETGLVLTESTGVVNRWISFENHNYSCQIWTSKIQKYLFPFAVGNLNSPNIFSCNMDMWYFHCFLLLYSFLNNLSTVLFSRVQRDSTPCFVRLSVGWSVGHILLFLWFLFFLLHCSCPNGLVTPKMAPAHPHATRVAVYLIAVTPDKDMMAS